MTKHQFVIDQEIDLFEKQGKENVQKGDLLNTSTYVNTLTNCVMSVPDDKPFNIGLFGEWGSGKSSIIKTFKGQIAERYKSEGKKVKVITYDAWKYANDSFRRMFLLQMQQDLGYEREDLMNKFYLNSSEDAHIDTTINKRKLFLGVLIVIATIFAVNNFGLTTDQKIVANALVALGSLVLAVVYGAFREVKVNIQRPHLFAPEQFEECFNEMCAKAHHKVGQPLSYLKWIKGEVGEEGFDRLVIVIDNVDRCSTDLAYELLTNIKNFLGCSHNTIFIIPVDEESLKKHLIGSRNAIGRESDEFLRKFFNICIRIKPFKHEEMYSFAAGINDRNNLGLERTTVSLVSNEFASNPRRIIQMFNNLLVELDSLPEDIAKNHQSLVCKLLIIREEYPDFYKTLQQDSRALFRLEDLEDKKDKDGKIIEKATAKMLATLRFLKDTTAVTSQYEDQLAIIDRILTNSNIYEKLPQNVIKEYQENAFGEETTAYVQESAQRIDLFNYSLKKLETAIHRGLWLTDAKNCFDRMLSLNKHIQFTNEENMRVVSVISGRDSFARLAEAQGKLTELIEYATYAEKQGVQDCANWLTLFIINENRSENKIKEDLLFACQKLSSNQVKKLDKEILKACQSSMRMIADYDYGSNAPYVFTEEVVKHIISQLPSDQAKAFECLVLIAKKIKLSKEQLQFALSTLSGMIPTYELDNSTFDTELGVLESTTQLLSLCHHVHLDQTGRSELDQFVETISKFILDGRTNRQIGFVLNNLDNEQFVDELLAFIHEYVIISRTKYLYPQTINTIANEKQEYSEKVVDLVYELHQEGYPVEDYVDTLLDVKLYNSNHIKVLDYILKLKNKNNKYVVNDENVASIYKDLIGKAKDANEENKSFYEKAILDIADDDRNKQVLRQLIQKMKSEEIQNLPMPLFNYAIHAFEEHFDDYKNNYTVLTLLSQKGSKAAKKKVFALLSLNLVSENLSDADFDLVCQLTDLTDKNKESLKESLDIAEKEHPNYSEKINKCLEHLGYKREEEEKSSAD